MVRSINFGAGPGKLPTEVLEEVQSELLEYKDGMSIMELSHRGSEFVRINNEAQKAVRELLNVPINYKILLLQGGGSGIFAAVALNLINRTGCADYVVTGTWSAKAASEATKYGTVNLVFPKTEKRTTIQDQSTWKLNPNASYLYYCDNETVDGIEFSYIPDTINNIPLVADMSSNFMTKKVDVSKFGLIFGGAQKNIGPAGVAVVIVREDLLGNAMKVCPSILDFAYIAQMNSIHNTPATFSVYVMEKVLQWIKKQGGLEKMEELSHKKSTILYDIIKNSNNFYHCPVEESARSRINVVFKISESGNPELEAKFLKEAEKENMFQLKGHRLVGGIRASLYNAVSLDDVKTLTSFMITFQKSYG